jgi:CubicO group peptidase (beta-lactamase class C family)
MNCMLPAASILLATLVGSAVMPPELRARSDADGLDPAEIAIFVDELFTAALEADRFPGGVVAVVQNGDVLFTRGYGVTGFESGGAVDPATTLFSVASVTKPVTATAVMQQVERGALDLHRDIADYLDFPVPHDYGPITLAHLLTHTPGLEDRFIGMAGLDSVRMPPLGAYLRRNMPAQIRPPGDILMYSNHGYALAAYAVERVTGNPFDAYVHEHIFTPLGMESARLRPDRPVPSGMTVSDGHVGGPTGYHVVPSIQLAVWPAGSLQATAMDMANFMIAHLEGGRFGDQRILDAATVAEMHRRQFVHHERLAGWTYGFAEYTVGPERALLHDGDLPGFNSRLFLIPDRRLGFFTVNNGGDLWFRVELTEAFLERFSKPADDADNRTGGVPASPSARETRLRGNYRSARYPRTTADKLAGAVLEFRVRDGPDGSVTLFPPPIPGFTTEPTRWLPAGPLVFRNTEREEYIAFRADDGRAVMLFAPLLGAPWSYHAIHWIEALRVQVGFLATAVLLFLSAALGWPAAALVRRIRTHVRPRALEHAETRSEARRVRIAAGTGAAIMLLFIVGLGLVFQQLVVGHRGAAYAVFSLPFLGTVPTAFAALLTVTVWRERFWGTAARVHLSAVVLALVLFIPFLAYWNLLGFRF